MNERIDMSIPLDYDAACESLDLTPFLMRLHELVNFLTSDLDEMLIIFKLQVTCSLLFNACYLTF